MAGKCGSRLRPNLGFVLVLLGAALPPLPLSPSLAAPDGTVRVAVAAPEKEEARPPKPVDKESATKRVQRCYFKNEHRLKAYGDFVSPAVQKKIKMFCKDEPQLKTAAAAPVERAPAVTESLAAEPTEAELLNAGAGDVENEEQTLAKVETEGLGQDAGEAAEAPETPEAPPARLAIDCLPEDLIAMLSKAHGGTVSASTCRPGCLPSPDGLSQTQLDELYGRYGVVWCRSCTQIEGHLSLKDIKRIEDAGHIEICSTPPRQLPLPGAAHGNVVKSFSRIRELYRDLPPLPEDPASIAVIIGNNAYDNLPPARTARSDAGAMYFFLTEHLGFRQDRIIDLRNAKRADFERVFGPVPGSDGELKRLVEAEPNAKVVVYYAGHGATNAAQDETYLLPVDAEPYREERGGYPLSTLYANLAGLKASSVLVLLESSFGRDHGAYILPPNIPETTLSVLPAKPLPSLTVLAAADRGQRALMDPEYDIGLFTRYLIEGLAGSADLAPVGNANGKVDSAELYAYTAALARLAARKTYGLLQSPAYSSESAAVLKAPGEMAAKPH